MTFYAIISGELSGWRVQLGTGKEMVGVSDPKTFAYFSNFDEAVKFLVATEAERVKKTREDREEIGPEQEGAEEVAERRKSTFSWLGR